MKEWIFFRNFIFEIHEFRGASKNRHQGVCPSSDNLEVIPQFTYFLLNALTIIASAAHAEPGSTPQSTQAREIKRWNQAGFKNPKIESWSESVLYPASNGKAGVFTHGIKITSVIFRNARWKKEDVKYRFQRLAEVYSQCGIKIQAVDVVECDAPNGWVDVDGIKRRPGDKESRIMEALPIKSRPVFFYVRSNMELNDSYAEPEFKVGRDGVTFGSIWMSSALNDDPSKPWNFPNFSDEAHELGHILGNSGHLNDGSQNFLAERPELFKDVITRQQCEVMKKSELVAPL